MREIKFREVRRIKENGNIEFYHYTLEELWGEDSWQGKVHYDFITTEQYTGLKDKNGKEIFEGDILNRRTAVNNNMADRQYQEYTKVTVIFIDGAFCTDETGEILSEKLFDMVNHNICWTKYKIIGNIHTNPELLKEN